MIYYWYMNKGLRNFLKVSIAAVSRPTRILVLGIGALVSLIFPDASIIMIPVSVISVILMSWADINNETFINKVLQGATTSLERKSHQPDISDFISKLEKKLESSLYPEVKSDLLHVHDSLLKIKSLLQEFSAEERAQVDFVVEYILKLAQKLFELTDQEQRARNYLERVDEGQISKDIEGIRRSIARISDPVAKKEYEKAERLKKEQLGLRKEVVYRLERIDSYIARIKVTFENAYANMTKISLKDTRDFVDEGEVVTESLEQIVQDIEDLEKNMISIEERIESNEDKQKKQQQTTEIH